MKSYKDNDESNKEFEAARETGLKVVGVLLLIGAIYIALTWKSEPVKLLQYLPEKIPVLVGKWTSVPADPYTEILKMKTDGKGLWFRIVLNGDFDHPLLRQPDVTEVDYGNGVKRFHFQLVEGQGATSTTIELTRIPKVPPTGS